MSNEHDYWTGPCPDPACGICNPDGNLLSADPLITLLTEDDRKMLREWRIDYVTEAA